MGERKCNTCLRRYPEKLLQTHTSIKNGLPWYEPECPICALHRRNRESGIVWSHADMSNMALLLFTGLFNDKKYIEAYGREQQAMIEILGRTIEF